MTARHPGQGYLSGIGIFNQNGYLLGINRNIHIVRNAIQLDWQCILPFCHGFRKIDIGFQPFAAHAFQLFFFTGDGDFHRRCGQAGQRQSFQRFGSVDTQSQARIGLFKINAFHTHHIKP